MIDHAKITICGNCEYSEQTRWGLLCRRLARQDAEGDVDDLYVNFYNFCCWGYPSMSAGHGIVKDNFMTSVRAAAAEIVAVKIRKEEEKENGDS